MDETRAIRRSGILLAGGRSSRMGQYKALLELAGEPLLCHPARVLRRATDELIVVATVRGALAEGELAGLTAALERIREISPRDLAGPSRFPVRLVHDSAPHRGPVAGLAAGLGAARGEVCVVAACDAPFLAPALVAALLDLAEGPPPFDAVLPRTAGGFEPLVAAYRTAIMGPSFAGQLARDELRPTARLSEVRLRVLDEVEIARFDPAGDSFIGVNDPDAYRAARERVAKAGRARGSR